jgi:hypothetical protein
VVRSFFTYRYSFKYNDNLITSFNLNTFVLELLNAEVEYEKGRKQRLTKMAKEAPSLDSLNELRVKVASVRLLL